ncbi:uncharacterized protein LOC121375483 [Gigantopelta aegis]|uniref:uncharacterized protein LOC121375483 n=1 Tax=Gigantopelta aegis TaxID=1735272 RepID=UPI001B8888AF|nr:uncharacterized protein LOC121375483 [Gigantopelta aegis]
MGLSVLWATANFTASLTNLFFVYLYAQIPLYGQINSIYMPVLEFILLVQFWVYGDHYGHRWKIVYTVFCFSLWSSIIALQLSLKRFEEMQWLAISLWCVETFPQVILNIKLRSTSGQSTKSVIIGIVGKTTDFISNYGLVIPMQYVIMTYFSSSVAFVNGIQVAWYYQDNSISKMRKNSANRDAESTRDVHPVVTEVGGYDGYQPHHHEAIIFVGYGELLHQYHRCRFIRRVIITIFCLILVIFAAALVWNTQTFYALFGPAGIASVFFVSHLYYKRRTSVWKYSPINNTE